MPHCVRQARASVVSFSSCTKRVAVWVVMSRKLTKTGLQWTSPPRKLSVQAMSSSDAISMPSACSLRSAWRMRANLEGVSSPVYSRDWSTMGFMGMAGRSVQMRCRMSRLVRRVMPPCCRKSFFSSSMLLAVEDMPSMATSLSSISASSLPSHSAMVGVPSVFSFINWYSVPFSCSAAAIK